MKKIVFVLFVSGSSLKKKNKVQGSVESFWYLLLLLPCNGARGGSFAQLEGASEEGKIKK